MKFKKLTYSIIVAILFAGHTGCSDFLDTQPTNAIPDVTAVENVSALRAILEQTYKTIMNYNTSSAFAGLTGYQMGTDLRCMDLSAYNHGGFNYYTCYQDLDNFTTNNAAEMWNYFYTIIRQANIVLANIDEAVGTNETERERVKGEAMALRAYSYFWLAQSYQQTYKGHENLKNVLLITEPWDNPFDTKYHYSRASTKDVYDLIRKDLNDAIPLLAAVPVAGTTQKSSYRVNKNIAQAMLAKVSLVTNEWVVAEEMANAARQGFDLMEPADYLKGFTLNSVVNDQNNREWMWHIPQTPAQHLADGVPAAGWANLNRTPTFIMDQVHVSYDLMDLYETYDVRFSQFWERRDNRYNALTAAEAAAEGKTQYLWTSNKHSQFFTGSFISSHGNIRKINPNYTGDKPGLTPDDIYDTYSNASGENVARTDVTFRGSINLVRAADMWLIEAEAKARQGKDAEALVLLNELREKRNASATQSLAFTGLTGNDLIDEILLERRRELYAEGSILFDLIRTQRNMVRGPDHTLQLSRAWNDYKNFFQIPQREFIYNTALSPTNDQNPRSGTTIPSNMYAN